MNIGGLNGWMIGFVWTDLWMDGCVHARVYLHMCAGPGCVMAHSRRPLTAEFSVQSCWQTALVTRVIAGTSGHGITLTLSSLMRTNVSIGSVGSGVLWSRTCCREAASSALLLKLRQ